MDLLQTVIVPDRRPDVMDVGVPLFPCEIGRNQIPAPTLGIGRAYQTADRSACNRNPAIHTMAPAAFGARRDIDRTVLLYLTQRDPCIEQGRFLETQTQRPGDFHGRRDPLVAVLAQFVGTLAHDPLVETCRRVGTHA